MASGASSTLTKQLRIELRFVTTKFLEQTRTAARALDILNSRLGKTQTSANETQQAFRQLAKESRAVGSKENTVTFQQNAKALREVSRSAKGAKTSLNQYSTAVSKAGNRSKEASTKMNGLDASSRKAGRGFSFANTSLSGFNAGLSSLFTVIGGRELIKTSLEFDRVRNRLKFATNNTEEFNEAITLTEATADRLGLALVETQRGFSTIAASAKGSALEGQPVVDLFNAVSNASAALSLSADETNSVFLAFSQIISKGKVAAEELRGQIGERLPGAFSAAARSLGVTNQELDKLLQDGQVIADDFLPKFAKELNNTFGDQALKNAQSFTAQINRLVNSLKTVADAVAKTKFFRDIVDGYSKIAEVVKANEEIEKSNENLKENTQKRFKKRVIERLVELDKENASYRKQAEALKELRNEFIVQAKILDVGNFEQRRSLFGYIDRITNKPQQGQKAREFFAGIREEVDRINASAGRNEFIKFAEELAISLEPNLVDSYLKDLEEVSKYNSDIAGSYEAQLKALQESRKEEEQRKKSAEELARKLEEVNEKRQARFAQRRERDLKKQLELIKEQRKALEGGTGKVNFIEAIEAGSAASVKLGIETRSRSLGGVDGNRELLAVLDQNEKEIINQLEKLNDKVDIEVL